MAAKLKDRASEKKEHKFPPNNLDNAPAVEEFLQKIGFGVFDRDGLISPPGRNKTWIGKTTAGKRVFVKELLGEAEETRMRIERMLSFQRFAESVLSHRTPVPRLVGHDMDSGIVAFEAITDTRDGAQLMVDEEFTYETAQRVGTTLASIHSALPVGEAGFDTTSPVLPSAALLRALPPHVFETSSFGELQAWQLLQQDGPLIIAVERLREMEQRAPRVPTHGDFRMDQLLIGEEQVFIIDWEEFRLNDAARDVGAFAGEWLYRSILDIVTDRGGQPSIVDDLSHEEIMRRGAANLERLTPFVRVFWDSYRRARTELDEEFVVRATAFAGWHTIDRLMAGSALQSKLTGIERAAAGIGRSALVNPDRFGAVIGFEETP